MAITVTSSVVTSSAEKARGAHDTLAKGGRGALRRAADSVSGKRLQGLHFGGVSNAGDTFAC